MRRTLRTLSAFLAAAMLLVMTASAQVAVTAPGELPIVSEPVTLTVGIASNVSVIDWETNEQSVYIEDKTGVTLDFIELPKDEFTTKINLMVAAGGEGMPDILMCAGIAASDSTLVSWGDTGLILPLNEYWENGMNYFLRDSIENGCAIDYETFVKYMTCYDGNIYAMPSYSESYNNQVSGSRLLIYQPWLDQLGVDRYSIRTTEDLYDVLCQFRDQDMNGNGENDEIPLIANVKTIASLRKALMNPFVYTASDYLVAEDGVVDAVFDREEFREGVRFVRRLVADGLLMPESFTQDETQMTALQSEELARCGVVARVSTSNLSSSDDKFYEYRHVITLTGPNGVCENPILPSVPFKNALISANCENPDAAFRLLDYLCSEEITIMGKFGREGKEWHKPGEGELSAYTEQGYPTVIALEQKSWADVDNYYWANSGPRMYGVKLFFGQADTTEGIKHQYAVDNANDICTAHTFCDMSKHVGQLPFDEEETEVYDTVYTPIVNYVNECWSRFVLGDLDVDDDADWDGYVSEANAMGLEDALATIQNAYNRSK